MDRHYYLMIDTETAGDLDSLPLVYDLGMQVIDQEGQRIRRV